MLPHDDIGLFNWTTIVVEVGSSGWHLRASASSVRQCKCGLAPQISARCSRPRVHSLCVRLLPSFVGSLSSFVTMTSSMIQRLANSPSTQTSPFLISCETIKAALSEHQCRIFASGNAQQALEIAKRLNDDNQHDSRFRSGMSTINDWIVGVQRYFSVIDIFVSSKPEVAALIWGSIRFLIEVCSHTLGTQQSVSVGLVADRPAVQQLSQQTYRDH
jgi:hypothetical protein